MNSSNQCVIDTYAWVEYLIGSKAGKIAKEHIDRGNTITPSIVIVELRKWYLKEIEAGRRREQEMQNHFAYVEATSRIVSLDMALSLEAGQTDFIMKKRIKNWPIADSIVYATARTRGAQVISGDPHFKGLEGVIFIG
jgi:predicted nucleic acid-binding protein